MTPEVKAAVDDMRSTIRVATSNAIASFQLRTGLTPSAITLTMVDVTTHGDAARVFMLDAVLFKFEDQ